MFGYFESKKMKPFKNTLSVLLVFALLAAFLSPVAPALPAFAEESEDTAVLTIDYNSGSELKFVITGPALTSLDQERVYTESELKDKFADDKVNGDLYEFSMMNTFPTKRLYTVRGVSLWKVFYDAGISTSIYRNASNFLQTASEDASFVQTIGPGVMFNGFGGDTATGTLNQKRYTYSPYDYYYDIEGNGTPIPWVISFAESYNNLTNAGSTFPADGTSAAQALRPYFGQRNVGDQNLPLSNNQTYRILFSDTRLPNPDVFNNPAAYVFDLLGKEYDRANILTGPLSTGEKVLGNFYDGTNTTYFAGTSVASLLTGLIDDTEYVLFENAQSEEVIATLEEIADNNYTLVYATGDSATNLSAVYDIVGGTDYYFDLYRDNDVVLHNVNAISRYQAPVFSGDPVCEIDATGYATFEDALASVQDGETIKLLTDIYYNDGIVISNMGITFDLNGYTLEVNNESGYGLTVTSGAVYMDGEGEFNVTGTTRGVSAASNSAVEVTNATGAADLSYGVHASAGSVITVYGDVKGKNYGAHAQSANTVVTVFGDVYGATFAGGISSIGATLIVYGNATGGANGIQSGAANTIAIVYGDAVGGSSYGANVNSPGGVIEVHGNAIGGEAGAFVQSRTIASSIVVDGNATGYNAGAIVNGNMATITVGGNVTATSETGIGALIDDSNSINGGSLIVNGEIFAPTYILFRYPTVIENAKNDGVDSESMPGYLEYTNGIGCVWVKAQTTVVPNVYTVTFDYNDGVTEAVTVAVEEGNTVEQPSDPVREGYDFLNWFLNDEPYDFDEPVMDNCTLVAQWEEIIVVDPEPVLVGSEVSAYVTKLSGNQNDLTVTVTETYSDGSTISTTETFKISNNEVGTFEIGAYNVYVDTKGNDQIRACYFVE